MKTKAHTVARLLGVGMLMLAIQAHAAANSDTQEKNMKTTAKDQVVQLLKSIETGDAAPVGFINSGKYIQHNLAVGDGLAGFGAVLHHGLLEGCHRGCGLLARGTGRFLNLLAHFAGKLLPVGLQRLQQLVR